MKQDDDHDQKIPTLEMGDRISRAVIGSHLDYGPTALLNASATLEDSKDQCRSTITSSRLLVPTTNGVIYLPCEGIVRLRAEGSYTHIYTDMGEEQLLICKGIGQVHQQLSASWFHRCHHTHVINLRKVRKLLRNGGYRAQMMTGEMVAVSRRKWCALLEAMGSLRS